MTVILFALAAFATYRVTRLVTADVILDPLRARVTARGGRVAYLATCDWCLSVWVAPWPTIAVLVWPTNRVVLGALAALAASAVTGLLATIEQATDR